MSEQWRPVVGYEGYYEVSNLGRVRSARFVTNSRVGAVLKPTYGSMGHPRVSLSRSGVVKCRYVHQMVLESFVGPRPRGMVACHENDIPHDNRLENLRWDTPRRNNIDAIRNGRNWQSNKENCPLGHPLELPNLVAASWTKHGHRSCLSCNREAALARSQRRPFDPERAHARAVDIMGAAV